MEKSLYELTSPQKAIWQTEQFYQNTSINNIGGLVIINQKINVVDLNSAINKFIESHDALRLKFTMSDDGVKQYIDDFVSIDFDIVNLKTAKDLDLLEKNSIIKSFDVLDSFLFNFVIFQFPDGHGGFFANTHHLIDDAWTCSFLVSEIMEIYNGIVANIPYNSETYSYIDFIKSEKEYLTSSRFLKDKEYWLNCFKTIPEVATLPSSSDNFLITNSNSCAANRLKFSFPKILIDDIKKFCEPKKVSLFNFFMGVFSIYLNRACNLDDFCMATPILNRTGFKEKLTAGMYISTVPFNVSIKSEISFADFIKEQTKTSLGLLKHQKYPYQYLLEELRKDNFALPKLYDILISYQNARLKEKPVSTPYKVKWSFNQNIYDNLNIHLYDINDSGSIDIAYDYKLSKYDEKDINSLHEKILIIINQILSKENILIKDIEILTVCEKQELLNTLSKGPIVDFPTTTIPNLFEKSCKKTPNNVAIVQKEKSYTYSELNNIVNCIAIEIQNLNITNKKIAIIGDKSPELIASLIAVMKSGNCYIPIDPNYPEERINYILQDSSCDIILTQKKYEQRFLDKEYILLDKLDYSKKASFENMALPNSLAYIIYTSGTTGKPKGVQIKHQNITNTLLWRKNYYDFNSSISVLQIPSYSFDSSVEDIFTPLISGSKLVLPTSSKMDINSLAKDIIDNKVNHFLIVASLYKILLSEKCDVLKNFKFITIAGEDFNLALLKEHYEKLPNVLLVNEYGPTENSVCSTVYKLSKDDNHILIGKPINNCSSYILDKNQNLLPKGMQGELYLAGKGLSLGYLNKKDLTRERFIKSKFSDEILYKTGDIVKMHHDGNMEFIGRNDEQVKLNGFRIELQEINNQVLKYPNIKDAVTIIKTLKNEKCLLISYIISDSTINLKELKTHLRKTLPHYMVPELILLDKFPLTPNGKLDKKGLPIPVLNTNSIKEEAKTPMEIAILNACREVLKNEELTINDDVFSIGLADSLNILSISSKLFAKNIIISTQDFYEYSTVKELANHLEQNANTLIYDNNKEMPASFKTEVSNLDFSNLKFNYTDVLLTGVTGYLGIHLLYSLLTSSSCDVHCIVRTKYNVLAKNRLEKSILTYLGVEFFEKFKKRIHVYDGQLAKENCGLDDTTYSYLCKTIKCIIHSAANTKHYGNYKSFLNANFLPTKNLAEFALKNNIPLNYMSTTSISGNYLVKNDISYNYTENDFYIGQNYEDNVYVKSKFESEKLIYELAQKGLNANVFRLGNLMARSKDGLFQLNKFDNAYYNRLLAFAYLGSLPKDLKNTEMEFTAIDDVANAIVKILSIPNVKNNVFHLLNPKTIRAYEIVNIINEIGMKCKFEDYDVFLEKLKNTPSISKYFLSDFNQNEVLNYETNIVIDNSITEEILSKAGFSWTNIDSKYIKQFFEKNNFIQDVLNIKEENV